MFSIFLCHSLQAEAGRGIWPQCQALKSALATILSRNISLGDNIEAEFVLITVRQHYYCSSTKENPPQPLLYYYIWNY